MFGAGLFDECVELINRWKPKQKYPNEDGYKKDLREFLFKNLNRQDYLHGSRNINVKEEAGRSLCDLAIGRNVGVELKLGKKGKIKQTEIDRLHGQVGRHKREYSEGVIVVLVGDINNYSEAEVRETLQRLSDLIGGADFGLQQFRLKLINKSDNKIEPVKQKPQNPFGPDFGNPFG